ncbi:MAG: hypothetical protein ACAF41_29120 [Leptolyngbya sp. BL-A-14]
MSVSPLKSSVLPATLLAGAVFSSLTVPLAVFGSEPVDIQLGQEQFFSGTVKDIAAPYVGVVGVLSIGMGVAGVAIAGWQQSSRKSEQVEAKLSNLKRTLEEKELQLQAALLSEQRLEASGLDFFLQDETSPNPVAVAADTKPKAVATHSKGSVVPAHISHTQSSQMAPDVEPTQAAVQSVVSTLAAAQSFLSFARSNSSTPADDEETLTAQLPATNVSLQELQDQLKQIMSHVETLRGSLAAEAKPASRQVRPQDHAVKAPGYLQHRPAVKPQWVMQQATS